VVVPSEWYENNPLSVLEAFALGRPVVGTRIGGIPELVEGDRGLCVAPGDARALSVAIRELAADRARAERMGRAARRYVERMHSPEVHYQKLMRIYAECLR
jgi:glycosyltransferase involved in cell wall biosynthesis